MANTAGKKRKNRVRKDDMVRVLTGKHRGSEGKVLSLDPVCGAVCHAMCRTVHHARCRV